PEPNQTLSYFSVDESTIRRVMAELTARGADAADLYFQHARANSITMEDGLISRAASSVDQGVGLRVVVGDQTGYAFTEDLSLEAMLAAARTAASIAHGSKAVLPVGLTPREHADYYPIGRSWIDVGIAEKLPLIQRLDAIARGMEESISKVTVSWADAEETVLIVDMHGNMIADGRPMTRLWCSLTATKNGKTQSNSANLAARRGIDWYTDERLEFVAREAIDRTMILFEARRPPAGELPVVLAAGASGILLHEAIGHGMEADFNRKGTSIYAEMLGKKVAPDFVTIVDNGTQDFERGALNVDDEGVPCERTVLVENGTLASYLHDGISARHYGIKPTGSGRRESFRHSPMPRMRSTYMENGPHTRDEIIASVKKGIIAETFTNGQVQIGAGDFTFYIKNGWLIEDGKITAPIKDINIIGNGPEALRNVTMVADDSKLDFGGWTCGKDGQSVPVSQGIPTTLVSKLVVGGENV
ncbi:MAG: TldD/PmbA family protein, partial [Myxococcales bacterium]|nr:TldD/PmbA family protein [Myxococcales bacterium]